MLCWIRKTIKSFVYLPVSLCSFLMYSSTNVLNGFVCNINMKMLYADEDTKLVCYNYLFYLLFLITGYNILLISFLPILSSTLYLSGTSYRSFVFGCSY